jgi:hypothetical protein
MKLNDVIGKDEQVILENIRRCKQFAGKTFKVIFRNDGLSSKECEEFVKRNEKMLFEIRTQITSINSSFDNCWFLIDSDNSDKCKRRYGYKGDILLGIAEYIKMVKHFKRKMNEDSNSWK